MTFHHPLARFVSSCLALIVLGCEPGAPADAGPDAPRDTHERPDVPRDIGPPCELSCGATQACCYLEEEAQCTDLSANVSHCGGCGVDCVASGRGDSCENRQCACGLNDIGCTGTIDECCPAVPGGVGAHCANVRTAFADCGGCGRECSPRQASVCQNGDCICGTSGRGCSGADDEVCCDVGPLGTYACVDTLRDRSHCGGCESRCRSDQRCDAGVCVSRFDSGATPDAGLDAGTDAETDDAGTSDAT